jgi:DNA-binding response OmpR family regulator
MAIVVVADDDDDIRELLAMKLSLAGHDVLSCARGDEALEAVGRSGAKLVILDISMPGLSGLEVLEQLRGRGETAHLPVLMLSAHVADPNARIAADDYLLKPFSPKELIERVERLLTRAESH